MLTGAPSSSTRRAPSGLSGGRLDARSAIFSDREGFWPIGSESQAGCSFESSWVSGAKLSVTCSSEEDDDAVYVRVILCWDEDDEDERGVEHVNCPVHVYLEKPLNGRTVIDVDRETALPLFVPDWEEAE
jgi:hypothetical protein